MLTADGYVIIDGKLVRGHVVNEDGHYEIYEGPSEGTADMKGVIVPEMVDAHTHCADAGVKPRPGMTLEELVAPPDGLKHRYLRETPRQVLVNDMREFEKNALSNGIGTFIDFREGGSEGCRMAKEACRTGTILGRPLSQTYDSNEVEDIISVADGIALPSISDMDRRYIEKVAEQAHREGKPFAIHCSERIREDMDFVLSLEPAFLVHMVEATDPDLKKCADLDIPIAVCPRSNRFFGKVPPLARMMKYGNTVAVGTDNAMLCSPDLRPEAALMSEILKDTPGSSEWIWNTLSANGRKLLYRTRGINEAKNMVPGFSVLPFEGDTPDNAWKNQGPVRTV